MAEVVIESLRYPFSLLGPPPPGGCGAAARFLGGGVRVVVVVVALVDCGGTGDGDGGLGRANGDCWDDLDQRARGPAEDCRSGLDVIQRDYWPGGPIKARSGVDWVVLEHNLD